MSSAVNRGVHAALEAVTFDDAVGEDFLAFPVVGIGEEGAAASAPLVGEEEAEEEEAAFGEAGLPLVGALTEESKVSKA